MWNINRALQIASVSGAACVVGITFMKNHIAGKLSELECYKTSVAMLRSHEGAVRLLGEPIHEGKIDLTDTENTRTRPYRAKMKVPLRGSKQRGELYLWAERNNTASPWDVLRVELVLEQKKDMKLVVYADPRHGAEYVLDFDVDRVPDPASSRW